MDVKNLLETGEEILWEGEGRPIDLTRQYPQTSSICCALEAIFMGLVLVTLAVAIPAGLSTVALQIPIIFGIIMTFIYVIYRLGDAPRRFLLRWYALDELTRHVPAAVIINRYLYVRRAKVPPAEIRRGKSSASFLRMSQDP
ncbi:MAG TPA: hypothetical protein VKK79_08930 [Candidatus Lokiarchaeia archaeon]|nr:hypothetical protein [Candidatus Lokiarchaeia archaeon]